MWRNNDNKNGFIYLLGNGLLLVYMILYLKFVYSNVIVLGKVLYVLL